MDSDDGSGGDDDIRHRVGKVTFCYLGDMLDAGCDSAGTARVRAAWGKFCKYLPILTGKRIFIETEW